MLRTALVFFISPVLPSAIYIFFSWDARFFSMVIPFTFLVTYALSILLIAPLLLLLYSTHHYNKYTVTLLPFVVLLTLFSGYFIYSYGGFITLKAAGVILVENSVISPDGWRNIVLDTFGIAVLGSVGGGIFYLLQNGFSGTRLKDKS